MFCFCPKRLLLSALVCFLAWQADVHVSSGYILHRTGWFKHIAPKNVELSNVHAVFGDETLKFGARIL